MSTSIDDVPTIARAAWLRLRDELAVLLGDQLVAMWAYGGTIAAEDDERFGDLDTFVVVRPPLDARTADAIDEAQAGIGADTGVEWDAWYVLEEDAGRSDPVRDAFRDRLNESWAVDRAHWLAGRYVLLHGAKPADLVSAPSDSEIAAALRDEVAHLERHVAAGDTDPYEATYAFLNGSRILRALATGDAVMSKREAGAWALEHLPARWLDAIGAARRAYEGAETDADAQLLAGEMAPFVAFVRGRLSG